MSCGSDKVVRLYEKTAEPLVLEDEAEEERERAENELITGETSAVQGQKQQLLPSRKTVNSEKAVSNLLYLENIVYHIYCLYIIILTIYFLFRRS